MPLFVANGAVITVGGLPGSTGGAFVAPGAFGASDWAINPAGTSQDATVSILALPDDGGSALLAIQYQIDGGPWVELTGAPAVGDFPINDAFTDGVEADVALRVITAAFDGPASATKPVTTAASPVAPTYTVEATDSLDGRTLTITTGTATGTPAPTYSVAVTLDGSPVSASGSGPWTYEVPSSASSQTVAWTVTATNSAGTDTSSGSEVVASNSTAPTITGRPTISGTTASYNTLTANAAAVSGAPLSTRTWQWERDGTPISGATNVSYYLVAADEGATLTVVQTETSSAGSASSESLATSAIGVGVSPLVIGSATYTPGGSGSGPVLDITDLELTGTTGPYDVFLATHASATTLTKDQIENGTGDAEDALTFSDADGVVNG